MHPKNKTVRAKRTILIIIVIFFALALGSYAAFRSAGTATSPTLVAVTRGNIVQEVSVTGNTKPIDSLSLGFEKGGKIQSVYVKVGTAVHAGDVLARLDTTELRAQFAQAQADVSAQQAKLNDLRTGARPEDIAVSKTALLKAQQDLTNDYDGVVDVLSDSYTKADDAVRNQLSAFFLNGETTPQLAFIVTDSQARYDSESGRTQSRVELNAWKNELLSISVASPSADLDNALAKGVAHLLVIKTFLNRLADVLASNTNLSDTILSTYRINLTTARTNVNTAIANVRTKQQTVASQALTVQQLQDELNLKLAGSTSEAIAAQAAQVQQSQANADAISAQLAQAVLSSPIDGVVTVVDAKVGEIAAPNISVISVISKGALEIEADIPETDIAKVSVGGTAKVTLDTFGSDVVFDAKVITVDPAETIIEGVATYKTDFVFTTSTVGVKPGMTANIDILSAEHDNVLVLPQRAITLKDGSRHVMVWNNGITEDRVVTIGLRGIDGNVEILNGLEEGDQVVVGH